MMVSNNKGITLIALVITIVVLLILASIGIGGAITGVDESTEQTQKSELKMVQHAVLQRYTKYSLANDTKMLVGKKIESVSELYSEVSWKNKENYENLKDEEKYYELNSDNLKELGITNEKDTYIVNYKTGEVFNNTIKKTKSGYLLYIYSDENNITKDDDQKDDKNPNQKNEKYIEESLIAYYDGINNTGKQTHDSTSNTWKDLSGNENDAELKNFENKQESGWQNGNSIKFDGDNDWISIESIKPNNTEANKKISNEAFTIETVVEYNSICEQDKSWEIISNREYGGFAIVGAYRETETKNVISFYDEGNGYKEIKDIEPIKINQKYHLLFTYNQNGSVKLYINGVEKGSINGLKYSNPEQNTILAIGANPQGTELNAADHFNGKIYSVRVYNKELNQTEVKTNYEYENARYGIKDNKVENYIDDGLRVYYDSINNVGKNSYSNTTTTWKDLSNHGNDGQLHNFDSNSGWQQNNGLVFDGSDDWVAIRKLNYDNFTIEAVVEYNQLSSYMSVIANVQNGGIEIANSCVGYDSYNGTAIKFQGEGGYVNEYSEEETEINKKYYISVTYDGNKIKLFENGNMYEIEKNGTVQNPENNTIWVIGANPDGSNADYGFLNGKIYSIRIYGKALDEEEIRNNYKYDKEKYKINQAQSKKEYTSNGLMVHYDSVNNTGEGDNNYSKTTTIWKDISNHGNDGQLHNFDSNSGWQQNAALLFDGSNDWVGIKKMNYPNISMEVTVEYNIVKSAEQDIICNFQSGGFGICGVSSKNKFAIHANSKYNWQNSNNNYEVGKKYHLVGTYDGENMKFYENGNLVATTVLGSPYKEPTGNTIIALGANPDGSSVSGCYFSGKIYSVKVYNRAITQDEVEKNYSYENSRYSISD